MTKLLTTECTLLLSVSPFGLQFKKGPVKLGLSWILKFSLLTACDHKCFLIQINWSYITSSGISMSVRAATPIAHLDLLLNCEQFKQLAKHCFRDFRNRRLKPTLAIAQLGFGGHTVNWCKLNTRERLPESASGRNQLCFTRQPIHCERLTKCNCTVQLYMDTLV